MIQPPPGLTLKRQFSDGRLYFSQIDLPTVNVSEIPDNHLECIKEICK